MSHHWHTLDRWQVSPVTRRCHTLYICTREKFLFIVRINQIGSIVTFHACSNLRKHVLKMNFKFPYTKWFYPKRAARSRGESGKQFLKWNVENVFFCYAETDHDILELNHWTLVIGCFRNKPAHDSDCRFVSICFYLTLTFTFFTFSTSYQNKLYRFNFH